MRARPIETIYHGLRFRSRLEARWAVFFDTLNIKYRYESEGYELENGERYLPDFYLPDYDMHVEVKGDQHEYIKALPRLVNFIEAENSPIKRLMILGNVPEGNISYGVYWFPVIYYHPLLNKAEREYKSIVCGADDISGYIALEWKTPRNDEFERTTLYNSAYVFDHERLDPIPDDILDPPRLNDDDDFYHTRYLGKIRPNLAAAYTKARQARFEYGETPA